MIHTWIRFSQILDDSWNLFSSKFLIEHCNKTHIIIVDNLEKKNSFNYPIEF